MDTEMGKTASELTADELLARINALAAKNKARGLSDEETKERSSLRAEYLRRFRQSLTAGLESIYYIGDDGKEHKLERKNKTK